MNIAVSPRPGFTVLCGYEPQEVSRVKTLVVSRWGQCAEYTVDTVVILAGLPGAYLQVIQNERFLGALNGYAGVISQADSSKCKDRRAGAAAVLSHVVDGEWPLSADLTGSFCAVVVERKTGVLRLCCDAIGPYPLFYSEREGGLVASTSLTLVGQVTGRGPDLAGLLESLSYPFVTYGRRTLAKRVKRLMPGEVRVYRDGDLVAQSFDTTLYKNVHRIQREDAVSHYVDAVRKELKIATGEAGSCHLGLSGGVDSRFLLGMALEGGIEVFSHTTGAHHDYEVVLARKIARLAGIAHAVYPLEASYHPDAETFHALVNACEAVPYLQWMPIIQWTGGDRRRPFFIGDLCEAAAGRTVALPGGRKGRAKAAIRGLGGEIPRLTENIGANAAYWRERRRKELFQGIVREADRGAPGLMNSDIANQIEGDIDESLTLIQNIEPPFIELCEELLTWFHYIRIMAFGQILLLDTVQESACPPMGLGPMRVITAVDPVSRTLQRFIDRILRHWKWKELSRVPTANAPLVPASAPSLIRDASWATRWVIDQALQRAFIATRGTTGYHRAAPSTDYFKLYREANIEEVSKWYLGKFLDKEHYMARFLKRRSGERWPLINNTIAGPAAMEILAWHLSED